jgi:cupin domain
MQRAAGLERLANRASGSGGRPAPVESSASAGFMAPLHAHEADESIHVLEGRLRLYAGGKSVRMQAGDSYVVERGVAHTYRVESWHARAVFTTFTRSAAAYESFLRAIGPVAPGAAWASGEDEATVTAIAAAAQTTVLGPPGMLPPGREHSVHAG